jgi:hypothetical protein
MTTQRGSDGAGDHALASPDAGWEHRLETLEARMVYLERELEGLQDGCIARRRWKTST